MKHLVQFLAAACLIICLADCKPKTQSTPAITSPDTSAVAAPVDSAISSATDSSASASSDGITEKYWKLTELMGKPVGPTPADKREVHIKFRTNENRLEGFGGCNGLGGTYELKQGDRIAISNILRTQMACPELDIENELIKVLETADNYNLNGDKLVLNKARMAPLARFEAVYFN